MNYKEKERLKEFELLCNEIDCIYHNVAINLNLSDSAYEILSVILRLGEGCNQTDICNCICINKQTVNSSIKQLIAKEILFVKTGKGREIKIYFTENGKKFTKNKIRPVLEAENKMMEELTKEEYEELIKLTTKYRDILKNKINEVIK